MKGQVRIPDGKGELDRFTGPGGHTYQVQIGKAVKVVDANKGRQGPEGHHPQEGRGFKTPYLFD